MGNLYLSTIDFAKIGLLVLNKGNIKKKQIMSSSWINELFQKKIEVSKDDPFASGYSYFWFLGSKEVKGHKLEYIYASGNGGNNLFVVPSQNLVVCLTSSAYGQGYGSFRSQNIFQYILQSLIFK
jgi:CubicO group peptidase (beta-lactamase class C family)